MIRIRNLKVPVEKDGEDYLLSKIAKKLGVSLREISFFQIVKKSIDARDKENIYFVYEVDISSKNEKNLLKRNHDNSIFLSPREEYQFPVVGTEEIKTRPVIVGSGPAGIFSAYLLAEAGYRPIILERGEKIEDRVKTVERFFETNELNPNSNIQFGEGGAGTFSDGKLNTLVKDKAFRGKKVFEIFVENGAPEEIIYLAKPHIGTDILRQVIISMREKIISWGGEFRYSSLVTDILTEDGKVVGVEINKEEKLLTDVLVLAIGHSARDTFYLLDKKNLSMKPKNFAVGLRIEHPQAMINKSQYSSFASLLPSASYKLTYQSQSGRGVYTFCMCPGGYVVNASSEKKMLAVNGMSNYQREGENANSAIVVTVNSKDYGDQLFSGLEFQRKLEKKAYELGNGFIPIQLYEDFASGRKTDKLGEVIPAVKGKYSFADLNDLFSKDITDSMKEAIASFGRKIEGFDRKDAILLGVESRTSSPIMMVRDEEGESNIKGIYPCGEGSGHAGGITTAAMDGIKIAESIAKKYRPFSKL